MESTLIWLALSLIIAIVFIIVAARSFQPVTRPTRSVEDVALLVATLLEVKAPNPAIENELRRRLQRLHADRVVVQPHLDGGITLLLQHQVVGMVKGRVENVRTIRPEERTQISFGRVLEGALLKKVYGYRSDVVTIGGETEAWQMNLRSAS